MITGINGRTLAKRIESNGGRLDRNDILENTSVSQCKRQREHMKLDTHLMIGDYDAAESNERIVNGSGSYTQVRGQVAVLRRMPI